MKLPNIYASIFREYSKFFISYTLKTKKRNFWRQKVTLPAVNSYVSAILANSQFYSLFIYSHVQEGF